MRKFLFAAVLLLVLTNAVVLSGVAYNRAGEPVSGIELTERELTFMPSYRMASENSGTALTLRWRLPGPEQGPAYLYGSSGPAAWLDDAKLSELGFDVEALKRDTERNRHRWRLLSRQAVLVLEYDGEAYRQALSVARQKLEQAREKLAKIPGDKELANKVKQREKWLRQRKVSQTRLYVVDAGFDQEALARKYADRNSYLFVRGEIGVRWNGEEFVGQIRQVYVQQVHVPLPWSRQITALTKGKRYAAYSTEPIAPRYRVRLDIGKRLEPWIVSVAAMGGDAAAP